MKREWIKIGSKPSTYLARCNAVYKAINKRMKVIVGVPNLLSNYKYINHTHYGSGSYLNELEQMYKQIHNKLGGIHGYVKLRKIKCHQYLKAVKDIAAKVNGSFSNDKLAGLFLKADDWYAEANSFLGIGTLYTDYLARKLTNIYGAKYLSFNFSSRTKISAYHGELENLLKIKDKYKVAEAVNKILKKYCWIGSFFFIGKELDKKQIYEVLGNLTPLRDKKHKRIMPRNPLVQEMSMLSHDRNEELEEFMLGEYYFRRLLNEIVKRLKISFDTLTYLAPGEIVSCLRGGRLPNQKIRQRKRQFGFLIINDQIKEFYGTKAKVLQEDVILKTDIIKGVVAYSSKAKIKGRVKIIQTSDDIGKLKKGDILVAIMTTPNFIQAMNNAAAIVTDEGGITCHVAIISRELEKPCIIGTKIATRMLKDGDWVEVNTEKGIVRRLK